MSLCASLCLRRCKDFLEYEYVSLDIAVRHSVNVVTPCESQRGFGAKKAKGLFDFGWQYDREVTVRAEQPADSVYELVEG